MSKPLPSTCLPAILLIALALGAAACGEPDQFVSIEFGMYPEEFEGETVYIDGEAVGTLESIGQATRMAFPCELGEHEVKISHPQLRMKPATVNLRMRGEKVRLMAEIVDFYEDGRSQPTIVLQ